MGLKLYSIPPKTGNELSLPMEGKFQLLENGVTEFGPGDPGYLGGRWWEDLNHNGIQDEGDHFFLCPLLPPGRPTPERQGR